MNHDAILFAMANPVPEIMPDLAKEAGAKVVGTGRSDFPNQINNVMAFPGISVVHWKDMLLRLQKNEACLRRSNCKSGTGR